MENTSESSRRKFIKKIGLATAAVAAGSNVLATENKPGYFEKLKRTPVSVNDKINIALIGAGGMGNEDAKTALQVPNTKIVAVCDLYDGRLKDAAAKWGKDLFLTKHYKIVYYNIYYIAFNAIFICIIIIL